jgi:hypothetical protein
MHELKNRIGIDSYWCGQGKFRLKQTRIDHGGMKDGNFKAGGQQSRYQIVSCGELEQAVEQPDTY